MSRCLIARWPASGEGQVGVYPKAGLALLSGDLADIEDLPLAPTLRAWLL